MRPVMTSDELAAFLDRDFPQARDDYSIDRVTEEGVTLRLKVAERHLRPGDTVSGPAIFGLVDVAFYLAILSRIGPVALAVTTHAGIDFLRKPAAGADLIATARILKLGRRLAVGDVLVRSVEGEAPVAHASLTYSIPPGDGRGQ